MDGEAAAKSTLPSLSMEYDDLSSRLQKVRAHWTAFSFWYQNKIEATCEANPALDRSVQNDFKIPLQNVERAMICCQEVLEKQGRFVFGLAPLVETIPDQPSGLKRNERTRSQPKYVENRKTVRIEADTRYGGVTKRETPADVCSVQKSRDALEPSALELTEQNFPELGSRADDSRIAKPFTKTSSMETCSDTKITPRAQVKGYKPANKRAKFVRLEQVETLALPPSSNTLEQAPSPERTERTVDNSSQEEAEIYGGNLKLKLLPKVTCTDATKWLMINSYFGAIVSITPNRRSLNVKYRSYSSAKSFKNFLKSGQLQSAYEIFFVRDTDARSEVQTLLPSQAPGQSRIVILYIGPQELSGPRTLSRVTDFIRRSSGLHIFLLEFLTDQEIAISFPSIRNAVKLVERLNAGVSAEDLIHSWAYAPDPSSLDFAEWERACRLVSNVSFDDQDPCREFFKRLLYLKAKSTMSSTTNKSDPAGEEFIPGTAKVSGSSKENIVRRGGRWLDGSEKQIPPDTGILEPESVVGTICQKSEKNIGEPVCEPTNVPEAMSLESIPEGSTSTSEDPIDDPARSIQHDNISPSDVLESEIDEEAVDESQSFPCDSPGSESELDIKPELRTFFSMENVATEREATLMSVKYGPLNDTNLDNEPMRECQADSTLDIQGFSDEIMSQLSSLRGEKQIMRDAELASDNLEEAEEISRYRIDDAKVMTRKSGLVTDLDTNVSSHGEHYSNGTLGGTFSQGEVCPHDTEPQGVQATARLGSAEDGPPQAAPSISTGAAGMPVSPSAISPRKESLLGKWLNKKRKTKKSH